MRYQFTVPVANGQTDPDPVGAGAANVPAPNVALLTAALNRPEATRPPNALALFYAGDPTDTLDVEVWTLDLDSRPALLQLTTPEPFKPLATDQWGLLVAATTVAGNTVVPLADIPCQGPLYLRVTTATLAADVGLRGACVVI